MSNTLSRQNRFRRFVYYLGIYTLILCIIAVVVRYSNENVLDFIYTDKAIPAYNQYINQNGNYLPYSGYKILQLIKKPLPSGFNELYSYLVQENELQLYFKLVPKESYHITLTNLKNRTSYNESQLKILKEEQELLDQDATQSTCTGKQLLMIHKREIRMQIELTDSDFLNILKEYQQRWKEKFPGLIIEQYTSFYITLAHQYQDIPNKESFTQLEYKVKLWQESIANIQLDPIEICSYNNLITYTAILPDETNDN